MARSLCDTESAFSFSSRFESGSWNNRTSIRVRSFFASSECVMKSSVTLPQSKASSLFGATLITGSFISLHVE